MNGKKTRIRLKSFTSSTEPVKLKSLSQVFLTDNSYLIPVIDFLKSRSIDTVLEIGPGSGVLTDLLLDAKMNLTCVEHDPRFTIYCEKKYAKFSNIKIINDDFLKFDLINWKDKTKQEKVSIVGNIPYSISSLILEKLLRYSDLLDSFVIMAQKEFIQKILFEPSPLGTLLNILGNSKILTQVPRTSFNPVPKVDSTILATTFNHQDLDSDFKNQFEPFFKFLKALFLQKKKKLKNTLPPFLTERSLDIPETFLDKRVHELNSEDLWHIFKLIKAI